MEKIMSSVILHIILAAKYKGRQMEHQDRILLGGFVRCQLENQDYEVHAIHVATDHLHIALQLNPDVCLLSLVDELSEFSAQWLNQNAFVKKGFRWQDTAAVYSYGRSQLANLVRFIQQQEHYHELKSFAEEMMEFQMIQFNGIALPVSFAPLIE